MFTLEAADDIAYSAADIEDGVKLGIINVQKVREIFEQNLTENKEKVLSRLDELYKHFSKEDIDTSIIIQKFRIYTQQIMIQEVIKSFFDNYDDIMQGTLENEIIKVSNAADIRQAYEKLQRIVFDNNNIIKKEIAGWKAIYGLLKIFVKASESESFLEGKNTQEARLFKLISSSHRYVFNHVEKYENSEYKKLQLIVDYIAGMTDSYAINLYQELTGIKI